MPWLGWLQHTSILHHAPWQQATAERLTAVVREGLSEGAMAYEQCVKRLCGMQTSTQAHR